MSKIRNNQQRGRFATEQMPKRWHSNACDEQCGCSYVEKYGPDALVSDAEFDRKCRRLCRELKHQSPCDERCGCSNDGRRQFVSDAEFDRKCRQMCRTRRHHNPCDEQCGCSYIEKYGPDALVSDAEYDRKCRRCHCGHVRKSGILGIQEDDIQEDVQKKNEKKDSLSLECACAGVEQLIVVLMQVMKLFKGKSITIGYENNEKVVGIPYSLSPLPPYSGVILLQDEDGNIIRALNLCKVTNIQLSNGNSFFDALGNLQIKLLENPSLALDDYIAKSERAMRIYLASLINTDYKVVINVAGQHINDAVVSAIEYGVVFLDHDKLVCINHIESAELLNK